MGPDTSRAVELVVPRLRWRIQRRSAAPELFNRRSLSDDLSSVAMIDQAGHRERPLINDRSTAPCEG